MIRRWRREATALERTRGERERAPEGRKGILISVSFLMARFFRVGKEDDNVEMSYLPL